MLENKRYERECKNGIEIKGMEGKGIGKGKAMALMDTIYVTRGKEKKGLSDLL